MADDTAKPKRGLLQRLGLQGPSHPPDPDEWVQVAEGHVSDPDSGFSARATSVVDILAAIGIEARQRPYLMPEKISMFPGTEMSSASERILIAVLVHRRDADRAKELLGSSNTGRD